MSLPGPEVESAADDGAGAADPAAFSPPAPVRGLDPAVLRVLVGTMLLAPLPVVGQVIAALWAWRLIVRLEATGAPGRPIAEAAVGLAAAIIGWWVIVFVKLTAGDAP